MAVISSSAVSCMRASHSLPAISVPSSPYRTFSFPSPPPYLYCRMRGSTLFSPSFLRRGTINDGASASATVSEEMLTPAEGDETLPTSTDDEQTVSVPVSPSDVLTMFFHAKGTMEESALDTVGQALEETGVNDLIVRIADGIASVELTKQTTVQDTGVASNLVEIIQRSGFKLQTLNLSFEGEDDMND